MTIGSPFDHFLASVRLVADYIITNPPGFSLERLKALVVPGNRSPGADGQIDVFFCLSTGRVGTKTLAALLATSPDLLVRHEPRPLLFGLSKAAYMSPEILETEFAGFAFQAARSDIIHHAGKIGRAYVETSPHATFLSPLIARALPGAKFIHLVRNPADVVRSGMRRRWYQGHPADHTRIQPQVGSDDAVSWENWSPFQKNCWLWSETNQWILDFTGKLPAERTLLMKSEDIYSADPIALGQLQSFIGLPDLAGSRVTRILKRPLNVQRDGDFPFYDHWADEEKRSFAEMVGVVASRLGYRVGG
ncbi:MAG: sulfotransferase [Pseudomonadota bacterium]